MQGLSSGTRLKFDRGALASISSFGCVLMRSIYFEMQRKYSHSSMLIFNRELEVVDLVRRPFLFDSVRGVSNKQRKKWKVRKYHFKLRLKRTMRKMRVPYISSKPRGQVKKKPILYDFRPLLRRRLKRAER